MTLQARPDAACRTLAHLLRVVRYIRVGLVESGQTAVSQAADDRHQRVEVIQLPQPLHSSSSSSSSFKNGRRNATYNVYKKSKNSREMNKPIVNTCLYKVAV